MTVWLLIAGTLVVARAQTDTPAEIVINFEKAEVGKPIPSWTEKSVVFTLASQPKSSKAVGRVMFFSHLSTTRKGILNAMAGEAIPVEIRFPNGASSVTLTLWGSIGSAALVEAFDKEGRLVDKASRDVVPRRAAPGDPAPTFELTVKARNIAYVRFSGSHAGGYLVADEVRFTPPPK